ncbi:hypothetical protein DEA8626_01438 [Defluviimonas aquaemixtae]|uniref:Uncharacterized protein n=1 Tax=Albidovulum aquaemixtae TaxID=1542388 RepID=A0A2R8B5X4_9RHOB|nr:hypothetical protein [Defluviimonas aquaemixtae]SPH17910.1 hypothetical protein DEA8626_01438 [Defluviimonas aquaemixtae]
MAQIVIDLSDKDMETMTGLAQANGFESAAAWIDELLRQHLAQEFRNRRWRVEDRPKEDLSPTFVTDPGGGVWHEDDYPGD